MRLTAFAASRLDAAYAPSQRSTSGELSASTGARHCAT